MKTRTKALLAVCSLIALMVATAFGTLAYLTDTDSIANTFTVGNVDIDLYEYVTDDQGAQVKTDTGKAFEDIIPGQTYAKKPVVQVKANSENAYVRMLLTVTYLESADNVLADHNYTAWFDFDNTVWSAPQLIKTEKADGKITRVFEARYKNIVEKPASDTELAALFTKVSIPGALDNTELATLEGFQVDLTANAIQAVGFENADAAWFAFNEQVNP